MICPTCRGRQFVSMGGADEDEGAGHQPCPDCIGGVASCCDAAGSVDKTAPQPNPKSDAICQPAPSFACLGCDSTVERLQEHAREQGREEEREKAAADIERETADEEGIDEEARMHRFDAESLRRHAAAIRAHE